MNDIRVSQDFRPLSEFCANAAAFVQQVRETRRPMVLTQRGRGAAVLLDIAEYEQLVERAELLDEIAAADAQVAEGRGMEHEDARRHLLDRLHR